MSLTSVHCGLGVQLSTWSFQKARPGASGSRFRKSWYCWRTNVPVSSTAFGAGAAESLIVTVAVEGSARAAPPVRFGRFTVNISEGSA